ncbi:MAG: HAD family phosphatase [Bacteroidales bacterium]|nr:HAD family phosphatase [Candidatus Cryptobacteroides caccocaballi]
MIKNLIFDFGMVLVDYSFEEFFKRHIPDMERCMAFAKVFNTPEFQERMDREEQPIDDIMGEVLKENPEFLPEMMMFKENYPDIVKHETEGMRELLTRLKAEGYKLYGLTNWCSKVHLTMAQYDIFKLLDGRVISSEEKVVKPEPEIYRILFDRYGLKPEECIFTDDRLVNIEGGRRVGMEGIVFQNAKQYETELRKIIASRMDD